MKKKFLSLLLTLMAGTGISMAVPANPAPGTVAQPDGTVFTARLHGDEFHNYLTTDDGYTVIKDAGGVWRYAITDADGTIRPGTVTARDADARTDADRTFLASIPRHLGSEMTALQRQARMQARQETAELGLARGVYNYNKFKGLVILVAFNDRGFSEPNSQDLFNDIMNEANYTGFIPSGSSTKQVYTGSVRDYFYDNSYNKFSPTFDVVGPVTVNRSQYDIEQTANARSVIKEAIEKIDSQVDFSKYDTDGDGTVDMFYVIFAGLGSNNTGNDSRLVWPHASTMPGNVYDGVKLGRYACSTELYGTSLYNCIDGIGTICHEFSHVLGLMDEYDTDYSGSGGQSVDPGKWSVMAGGSYNNYARTPVGYSLLQRYQSNFTVPKILNNPGQYSLADIDVSGEGYRINTSDSREYFLLENRRKTDTKWNVYLPGEGMLIYRVDSTDVSQWTKNTINADPSHNYYEMVRANPNGRGLAITDSDGDPFPGSGNVHAVGPYTEPSLTSWNDRFTVSLQLEDINEDSNGLITFRAAAATGGDDCEDFESMTTTGTSSKNVAGKYCNWSFTKGGVYEPGTGLCNGTRAAGLAKGGTLETSAVDNVTSISMRLFNSADRTSNVRVQYYDNALSSWIVMEDREGNMGTTMEANSAATLRFDIPETLRQGLRIQIKVVTGSDTKRLYIDDVQMRGVTSAAPVIDADTAAPTVIGIYDMQGRRLRSAQPGTICIIRYSDGTARRLLLTR